MREFKCHFDSVVLALSTNFMVQIDLVWAQLSPALRFASILKVYVEGKAACQVCELRCAPKSGMAPRRSHFLIQNFLRPARPTMVHGWRAHLRNTRAAAHCLYFLFSTSRRVEIADSCIEITYYRDHSRDISYHSRDTRDHAKGKSWSYVAQR